MKSYQYRVDFAIKYSLLWPGYVGIKQAHDLLIDEECDCRLRHDSQHIGQQALVEAPDALSAHGHPQGAPAAVITHSSELVLPLLNPRAHNLHARSNERPPLSVFALSLQKCDACVQG